jgi:hypothetical protein
LRLDTVSVADRKKKRRAFVQQPLEVTKFRTAEGFSHPNAVAITAHIAAGVTKFRVDIEPVVGVLKDE